MSLLSFSLQFFQHSSDEIVIKPGMTASVDIKAMERTVLSYLTKQITKTLSEGMSERKNSFKSPYILTSPNKKQLRKVYAYHREFRCW